MSAPSCYVCGSAAITADAGPHNPTCERCRPARGHTVSMQRDQANGDLLAICRCGWEDSAPSGCHALRDLAVAAHWLDVIEAAVPAPASFPSDCAVDTPRKVPAR